jgi:hypothetical protein
MLLVLCRDLLTDLRRHLDRLARRHDPQLDFRGAHQILHQNERFARGLADRREAVVVHDQRAVLAEVLEDALALAEILGDALVGMIADAVIEAHRLLRHHPQAALEAGHRHAELGVDMHDTVHVGTALQDAAVQREARPVDAGALVEVGGHVDLLEVGGGYLVPQKLVLLHEQHARLARNAHRAVIIDEIVPALERAEAIHRGEVDAGLPLLGGHAGRHLGRGLTRRFMHVHDDPPAFFELRMSFSENR